MIIQLREAHNNKKVNAKIIRLDQEEMPLKKDGWQFNWSKIYRNHISENSVFYGLYLADEGEFELQGIVLFTLDWDIIPTMKNIELAPHNIGKNKEYKDVAGCLIAYLCFQSIEKGKENYAGFVAFTSKTALIEHYQEKYGAQEAMRDKMFFDKKTGKVLIKKYLKIEL